MTWAIVFWTPLNTVCPNTANVCSSSASADGIRTAKAGPNFAGPGLSHAARSPACWTPCRWARMFGRPSATSWRHVPRHKRNACLQAFSQMEAIGLDRHSDDVSVVVDMDGAKARWMLDVSPCLTRTRAALGFYLPARGRRMTLAERFRLQGIPLKVMR